ncbi:MAG: hypothetical protein ACLQE9_05025 [Roseiarcus sp.]
MNRWGVGAALALAFSQGVCAGDLPSSSQFARTRANTRCGALGAGFFPIAGSDACVRISGHISAGAGFATGAARGGSADLAIAPSAPNGFGAEAGMAGDFRFDTANGPGRIYLSVESAAGSPLATGNQ